MHDVSPCQAPCHHPCSGTSQVTGWVCKQLSGSWTFSCCALCRRAERQARLGARFRHRCGRPGCGAAGCAGVHDANAMFKMLRCALLFGHVCCLRLIMVRQRHARASAAQLVCITWHRSYATLHARLYRSLEVTTCGVVRFQVTLTDLPGALPLLRRNAAAAAAAIAAAGGSATVAELDWAGAPGWLPSSWPAPPAAAAPTAGAEPALSCRCAAEDGAGADRARQRPAQARPCAERTAESACGWAGAAAPAASCQPRRCSGRAPDEAPTVPGAHDAGDARTHAAPCCGRVDSGGSGNRAGRGQAAEAPDRPGAPAAEAAGQAHAALCCGRVGSGVREGQGQAAEAPAHPGALAEGAALCDARYDLLLGADLVYTAAAVAPLANAVARALRAPSGGRRGAAGAGACGVLLAHKDRHAHVTAGLMRALEALGLRLEPVGVSVRSPAVRVYVAPASAHAPDAGTAGGVQGLLGAR